MKICFLDPRPRDKLPTPDRLVLDGPGSMLWALARTLATRHQVSIVGGLEPGEYAGVTVFDPGKLAPDFWPNQAFDAVIGLGTEAWPELPAATRRVCWQHEAEPPGAQLATALASGELAALVCVGFRQYLQLWRSAIQAGSALDARRLQILPNPAEPVFQAAAGQASRSSYSTLRVVCASRRAADLELMLEIFPALHQRFTFLNLQVLVTAEAPLAAEQDRVLNAHIRCRQSAGLERRALSSKAELADALAQAHILVLPALDGGADSALAARDGLAAGCRVVSSDCGGLPEATAGMARLVPFSTNIQDFGQDFLAALIQECEAWQRTPAEMDQRLADQARRVAGVDSWEAYAAGWEQLLAGLQPGPALTLTPRPLRWCFLDANPLDYQVASPESIPLGGSQSALCYLARSLAARGHQVSVLNQTSQPARHLGVECLNYHGLGPDFWHERDFDLVVCLNDYQPLLDLPAGLKARCVFWNQHNLQVEKMDQLSGILDRLEQVVYVSAWQQGTFQEAYGVPPGCVCPNACPPFYQPLPSVPATYLAARPGPLTLAYTSTPNRGLSLLLAIFPGLRQLFPNLVLKVFSSLKVYQMPAATDAEFSELYAESATLPGSEYHGSIPQPELAAALRGVHILAYPNIYEETSCIAVIEAMAAGCQIVTSDRGALPETTAGFASLVPFSLDLKDFGVRYFDTLCAALRQWQTHPEAMAAKLQAQSRYTLEVHNWQRQAENWEEMAYGLMAGVVNS